MTFFCKINLPILFNVNIVLNGISCRTKITLASYRNICIIAARCVDTAVLFALQQICRIFILKLELL